MDAMRDVAHRLHLPTTFVKFLIVGGWGFMISQFVLFLIYDADVFRFLLSKHTEVDFGLGIKHPDILLLIGSIISVEAAIVFQFNAHERWTFWDRRRSDWAPLRFFKFNISSTWNSMVIWPQHKQDAALAE